jgi:prepilin-type processing-associated H-X9-DG protein
LVVIAIIAILAAILFPVFARARENARRASCQSNLKQIALGIMMYAQDYDEKLPNVTINASAGVTASNPYGWADAMQPYLKSTQIFQCPSETTSPSNSPIVTGYTDYWINSLAAGKSDATFDYVANTILLGDGGGATTARYSSDGCIDNVDGNASATTGFCATGGAGLATISNGGAVRHLDGSNVAFADGHVKWEKGISGSSTTADSKSSAIYNGAYGADHGNPTFKPTSGDL